MTKLCGAKALAAIDPAKTAHLAIDVQGFYFDVPRDKKLKPDKDDRHAHEVAGRISSIAPAFNKAGLARTYWIYHTDLPEGQELYKVKPAPEDAIFPKDFFSAFKKTELAENLTANNIDTLLISGGYTNQCVMNSVRDALKKGFKVFVLTDCITPEEYGLKQIFSFYSFGGGSFKKRAFLTRSYDVLAHLRKAQESAVAPQKSRSFLKPTNPY